MWALAIGAAWPVSRAGVAGVLASRAAGLASRDAAGKGVLPRRLRRMATGAMPAPKASAPGPWLAAVQGGAVPWAELREGALAAGGSATGVALVRCAPGEDTMVLAVEVVGRQFMMLRRKDEAVSSALARLKKNVEKAAGGGKKGGSKKGAISTGGGEGEGEEASPSGVLALYESDGVTAVDGGVSNEEAFAPGRVLAVGNERLEVRVNEPVIGAPLVEGGPIVGCPLAPQAVAEFCEVDEGKWLWERQGSGEDGWRTVGREMRYVPQEEDVGAILRVTCVAPGATLVLHEGTVLPPVVPSPDRAPHARRLSGAFSGRAPAGMLRVMSYNVLADAYSKFWGTLHWYCPEEKLARGYRLPLLAKEVLDFWPDVVSLQEVDVRSFDVFWVPQMRAAGFDGYMTPKSGEPTEGCALFWRTDRLRAVSREHIAFRDLARGAIEGSGDEGRTHAWLADLVRANPSLENVFSKVKSIAQVAVLEETGGENRRVIITNTHAFFHPNAGAVRAVQAKLLTSAVDRELAEHGPGTGVVLTGDFNSQSYDLSVKFLLGGELSPAEDEWASSSLFRWGRDDADGGWCSTSDDDDGDDNDIDTGEVKASRKERKRKDKKGGQDKDTRGKIYTYEEIMGYLDRAIGTADPFVAADCYKHVQRTLGHLQSAIVSAPEGPGGSPPAPTETAMNVLRARAESMKDTVQGLRARARERQVQACAGFVPPKDSDATVVGVGAYLRHGLSLQTAIGYPEFTNYVDAFQGDLDWILVGSAVLEPVAHAPFPDKKEVTRHVAMPSEVWPSDHVSIVADIAWKN